MSKSSVLGCLVLMGLMGCGAGVGCPDGYVRAGDLCMERSRDAGPRSDAGGGEDGAVDPDGAIADAGVDAPATAPDAGPPDAGEPCVPHEETCNEIDDDCDTRIDEALALTTAYDDADADGFGAPGTEHMACPASALVVNDDDCDDSDPARYPAATETCDGVDANCDGVFDTELMRDYFTDGDGDGYGVDGSGVAACAPSAARTATVGRDCNDACPSCHFGGTEICDGLDQDCMGGPDDGVRETFYLDRDGDGHGALGTPATYACTSPAGMAPEDDDCVDSNAAVHPGATEICNDMDDNCAGGADEGVPTTRYFVDPDRDGHAATTAGAITTCRDLSADGYTARDPASAGYDCGPADPRAFPGQTEYQTTPVMGRVPVSYDFDCSGSTQWQYLGGGSCTATIPCTGVTNAYVGTSAPACGSSGTLQAGCSLEIGAGCVSRRVARTQGCR